MSVRIELIDKYNCSAYVAFLDSVADDNKQALAYHYPFYLDFICELVHENKAVWKIVCAVQDNQIVAAIPFVCVQEKSLRPWLSIAYFGANGGVICPSNDSELIQFCLKEAQKLATQAGADSLTIYSCIDSEPNLYRKALGMVEAEVHKFTQVKKLQTDTSVSQWKQSVRYDVKIAPKEGAICREIQSKEDLKKVWDIYHQNCLDRSIPVKPFEHISYLFKSANRAGIFLLCEYNDQIIGGLIVFLGGRTMSYYLPCSMDDFRWLQTNLFLLDEAIKRALPMNIRFLNFEGSPDMEGGVFNFKKRCGGEVHYFDIFIKGLNPDLVSVLRAKGKTAIQQEFPNTFVYPFQKLE